jgi:methionine--tRNA ligase beta chain
VNPVTLTEDMKAVIRAAHLCFAATVTPDGRPNVSPKGTIRVWDDGHLYFLDIASPGTRENLRGNPRMELNVVEALSRRGYRFSGPASLHRDDAIFQEAMRRVFEEEKADYPVEAVVLLAVEQAAPLLSPGYLHIKEEHAMRALWRVRRGELDREFDAYLAGAGSAVSPSQIVPAEVKPEINLQDLERIDVRAGTIRRAEDVPGSAKLVRLTVDFGSFTRTILAGMKKERKDPREIEGRQAHFVVNLAPRTMAGEVSQGMLFDIGYADGLTPVLAIPEAPVPDGARAG